MYFPDKFPEFFSDEGTAKWKTDITTCFNGREVENTMLFAKNISNSLSKLKEVNTKEPIMLSTWDGNNKTAVYVGTLKNISQLQWREMEMCRNINDGVRSEVCNNLLSGKKREESGMHLIEAPHGQENFYRGYRESEDIKKRFLCGCKIISGKQYTDKTSEKSCMLKYPWGVEVEFDYGAFMFDAECDRSTFKFELICSTISTKLLTLLYTESQLPREPKSQSDRKKLNIAAGGIHQMF